MFVIVIGKKETNYCQHATLHVAWYFTVDVYLDSKYFTVWTFFYHNWKVYTKVSGEREVKIRPTLKLS